MTLIAVLTPFDYHKLIITLSIGRRSNFDALTVNDGHTQSHTVHNVHICLQLVYIPTNQF